MNGKSTRTPAKKLIKHQRIISTRRHTSTDFRRSLSNSMPRKPSTRCNGLLPAQRSADRCRITINVAGEKYQTYAKTLERYPDTLLGDVIRREKYYQPEENEYFFDRDRAAFAAIIYYYQSEGQFYCPVTLPLHILVSEANFFDLGPIALNQVLDVEESNKCELPDNKLKQEIWKLFEIPNSGAAANLLTIFSVIVIICSVTILCIETLPYFKGYDVAASNNKLPNPQAIQPTFMRMNKSRNTLVKLSEERKQKYSTNWKNIFGLCETGIVAWFTLEFLVRFLSCPSKIKFLKSCMNIIDLLAIIPYYVTLIFQEETIGLDNIRIIRLVRVFRIFKLSRHSRGLQILGRTLKASIRELGLLIFFLLIGVILFSSAIYYVEMQNFQSIPNAFWWAIITMCTVGYGDNVSCFSFIRFRRKHIA